MSETLKFRQSSRVLPFALENAHYDVHSAVQDELVREALLNTRKLHPGKVITSVNIVFCTPCYYMEAGGDGVQREWYEISTRATVEIDDPPIEGTFSRTSTDYEERREI